MKKVFMTLYGPLETDARVQRSILSCVEKGYEVKLISCHSDKRFKMNGVDQIDLGIVPLGLKSYLCWVILCLFHYFKNQNKVDMIYLQDYYSVFPGLILSFFTNKDIYYDAHELILKRRCDRVTWRNRFFIFMEKVLIRRVTYLIEANSERETIMRRFYHVSNTIHVLNISKFRPAPHKLRKIDGPIYIVYQGNLAEERNLSFYIEALIDLPDNYNLMFIGSGPSKSKYESMVEELKLSNRVLFTGRLSNVDMLKRMESCHIGIISYPFTDLNNIYCSPNKIFEYAVMGMPFIATPQPFIKRVEREYHIGTTFELGSKISFVNKVQEIVNAYHEYSMGVERFLCDYSYENEMKKLKDII